MEPNPTYKISHGKGNQKQNEKTTYKVGKNICKWCDQPQGSLEEEVSESSRSLWGKDRRPGSSMKIRVYARLGVQMPWRETRSGHRLSQALFQALYTKQRT